MGWLGCHYEPSPQPSPPSKANRHPGRGKKGNNFYIIHNHKNKKKNNDEMALKIVNGEVEVVGEGEYLLFDSK